MDNVVNTPADREFIHWHKVATDALVQAATNPERVMESLDASKDYGRRALLSAASSRERMLAIGVLLTTEGVRTLYEVGLETDVRHDKGAT